ncbi:MAG: hypothetical protein N3A02_04905 [Rectinema sp.]|nr:hypothetical protein [Rectinema sp.]
MNREFHYYIVHYLARSAGFQPEEAEVIAISSQMVDESRLAWDVYDGSQSLKTEITQNYLFWDPDIARKAYLPFHFVPGNPAEAAHRRRDRTAHPLAVTADSSNVRSLLVAALRSQNLFRIGIALHAYADSWAHQNFSGTIDSFNQIGANTLVPAAGHLQAGTNPDIPDLQWEDPRLEAQYSTISNRIRFIEAARMIYRFLCTSKRRHFDDEPFVLEPLETLWQRRRAHRDDQIAIASDYVIYLDVPLWDPGLWLREVDAEEYRTPEILRAIAADGFGAARWDLAAGFGTITRGRIPFASWEGSRLAQWNSAVSAHRREFESLMQQKGIPIP